MFNVSGKASLWLSVLFVASPASAIAPDRGLDLQYRYVGECGGASGTAISRRAMITAKHVPGLTFGLNGQIFTAVQRVNHPQYDLAIFLFDQDLPGWHPLGAAAPIGASVNWVGYGGTGYPNFQWHGYDIRYGNFGRHAGTNSIAWKWNMFGLGPALVSMLGTNPDAAAVNGDSGGACFSKGRLVGVISYAFSTQGNTLPYYGWAVLNGGVPYHGSGAIDLTEPEIRKWVLGVIRPISAIGPPHRIQPQGGSSPGASSGSLPLPFFTMPSPGARR